MYRQLEHQCIHISYIFPVFLVDKCRLSETLKTTAASPSTSDILNFVLNITLKLSWYGELLSQCSELEYTT